MTLYVLLAMCMECKEYRIVKDIRKPKIDEFGSKKFVDLNCGHTLSMNFAQFCIGKTGLGLAFQNEISETFLLKGFE